MTPLHILTCSSVHYLELYCVIVEIYPTNLITEHRWGATPLLYAFWGAAPAFLSTATNRFIPYSTEQWWWGGVIHRKKALSNYFVWNKWLEQWQSSMSQINACCQVRRGGRRQSQVVCCVCLSSIVTPYPEEALAKAQKRLSISCFEHNRITWDELQTNLRVKNECNAGQ
jgi:hypothetical protein